MGNINFDGARNGDITGAEFNDFYDAQTEGSLPVTLSSDGYVASFAGPDDDGTPEAIHLFDHDHNGMVDMYHVYANGAEVDSGTVTWLDGNYFRHTSGNDFTDTGVGRLAFDATGAAVGLYDFGDNMAVASDNTDHAIDGASHDPIISIPTLSPPPYDKIDYWAFKSLDVGAGILALDEAYPSLAAGTQLVFDFTDLELSNLEVIPGRSTETWTDADGNAQFNLYANGALIAIGSDMEVRAVTDTTPGSMTYGKATGTFSVTLAATANDPGFVADLAAAQNGSTQVTVNIGSFDPKAPEFYNPGRSEANSNEFAVTATLDLPPPAETGPVDPGTGNTTATVSLQLADLPRLLDEDLHNGGRRINFNGAGLNVEEDTGSGKKQAVLTTTGIDNFNGWTLKVDAAEPSAALQELRLYVVSKTDSVFTVENGSIYYNPDASYYGRDVLDETTDMLHKSGGLLANGAARGPMIGSIIHADGVLQNGQAGKPLQINLNLAATPEIVEQLISQIGIKVLANGAPTEDWGSVAGDVPVSFELTDGTQSAKDTRTVSIVSHDEGAGPIMVPFTVTLDATAGDTLFGSFNPNADDRVELHDTNGNGKVDQVLLVDTWTDLSGTAHTETDTYRVAWSDDTHWTAFLTDSFDFGTDHDPLGRPLTLLMEEGPQAAIQWLAAPANGVVASTAFQETWDDGSTHANSIDWIDTTGDGMPDEAIYTEDAGTAAATSERLVISEWRTDGTHLTGGTVRVVESGFDDGIFNGSISFDTATSALTILVPEALVGEFNEEPNPEPNPGPELVFEFSPFESTTVSLYDQNADGLPDLLDWSGTDPDGDTWAVHFALDWAGNTWTAYLLEKMSFDSHDQFGRPLSLRFEHDTEGHEIVWQERDATGLIGTMQWTETWDGETETTSLSIYDHSGPNGLPDGLPDEVRFVDTDEAGQAISGRAEVTDWEFDASNRPVAATLKLVESGWDEDILTGTATWDGTTLVDFGWPSFEPDPTFTFAYGDFALGSPWVVTEDEIYNSTVEVTANETGGNPGAYLTVHTDAPLYGGGGGSSDYSIARATFHNTVDSYDPATQGAIGTIDYSVDVKDDTNTFGVQGFLAAVWQDGALYTTSNAARGYSRDAWSTVTLFDDLGAADFTGVDNSHPDFSAAGSPIEFGFVLWNSGNAHGIASYDNLAITIDHTQPTTTSLTLGTPSASGSAAVLDVKATSGVEFGNFQFEFTLPAGVSASFSPSAETQGWTLAQNESNGVWIVSGLASSTGTQIDNLAAGTHTLGQLMLTNVRAGFDLALSFWEVGSIKDEAPTQSVAIDTPMDITTTTVEVHTWTDKALSGVTLDGVHTTGADGMTSMSGTAASSLTLTPAKPADANVDAAVDLQDAIAILKMIVGLDVNAPGQVLSPYQVVAGDFDASGAVDLNDAIGVLKHVVDLPAPDPKWVFVEQDATLTGISTLEPGDIPATITTDVGVDHGVELVGILRGDVNGSWELGAG